MLDLSVNVDAAELLKDDSMELIDVVGVSIIYRAALVVSESSKE